MLRKSVVLLLFLLPGVIFVSCSKKQSSPVQHSPVKILWAEWSPSQYLQKLSEDFTAKTGIPVEVHQVAWDRFYDVFFADPKKYDLVAGDSQWLGRGVKEGVFTELTAWIKQYGVDKQMEPACLHGYSEYPKDSGRYWAVPLMGDAMGFAYRKDLFEDPVEKKAFQERYGYALDVPQTWAQLKDIAEFFYRPEKDLYGITVWASDEYDGLTMGVETFIWAWGGSLRDDKSYKVRGFLDSKNNEQALEFYKSIHALGHPQWRKAYLDANIPFVDGKAAMTMSYFAFFPDLLDRQKNPFAENTGFFANPQGPAGRFSSLGGQGLSVVGRSRNKDAVFLFLQWFIQPQTQRQWAQLGGYSCDSSILSSREFLDAQPYNRALAQSMSFIRDFWNIPEYENLLAVSQKEWGRFLFSDDVSAKEALNATAQGWENILEEKGYYKE